MIRLLGALLVAATLAPSPAAAQAPDRSTPPKVGPPPSLKLPPIRKLALTNGLPVWMVELHEVPIVQVNLLIRSGSSADPAGKFGLASLTSAMLDEGAGTRSALELADAIEFLGATLGTTSSFDASGVRLQTPVARLDEALAIMADVAIRPTFPGGELDRLRRERLTALQQARDDPAAIVGQAFPRLLFGPQHRYGTGAIGTAETLGGFTVEDLKRFHTAWYRPQNAAVLVVGDLTPERAKEALEKAFGTWSAGPPPRLPAIPEATQVTERRVFLLDRAGAAQSQIRIGRVGVPRSTPDYFPILVLNTILGGSFTSRLNQNLREEHGYAYGAGSAFDMRASAGPFFAAAGVQTDKTAEALSEFFKELNGILQPIPAAELEKAKNYLALSFPGELETTGNIAGALAEMVLYDLPEDYLSTYVARVQQVTAADVQRVAARHIQPNRMAVVVVGDLKTIEAPVRALKLGPVTVVGLAEIMGPATQ
jgi:predicted Zn-dependent peptidase